MEAIAFHGASNVTAILDLNRLGQRGPTMHGWAGDVFRRRAEAFGWNAAEIYGHDVAQIDRAYRDAIADDHPTFIVARTEKGHGVSFLANQEGWHGKAVPADQLDDAIDQLGGMSDLRVTPPSPPEFRPTEVVRDAASAAAPVYDGPIATRKAFGDTLAWLAGRWPDLVVLDGEVGNSTYTDEVEAVAPERFVELYIAEGCMLGAATGLQALGRPPSRQPSGRSGPARRTTSGWARSAEQISGSADRTPGSRSVRTALRRWRWRTSPSSGRSTAQRCSIRRTVTAPCSS